MTLCRASLTSIALVLVAATGILLSPGASLAGGPPVDPAGPRANAGSGSIRPSGIVSANPALARVRGAAPEGAPSLQAGVLANTRVNQDAGAAPQNEPAVAINQANSLNVVAGANDYRGSDSWPGFYYSNDAGATWADGLLPGAGLGLAGGDPGLAFDHAGNVYYSYIAFSRTLCPPGGIYVSKSTSGGANWSAGVQVAANSNTVFNDKPLIVTGQWPPGGRVYVTWTRFNETGCNGAYISSPIMLSWSGDGGTSFSAPVVVNTPTPYNQGSVPATGANGVLYVVYENWTNASDINGHIYINKSTDGGATFGAPVKVADVVDLPYTLPGSAFRTNSFPTIGVDANNGIVYVAWGDYRNGDADILLSRSTNGGATWSAPLRINNDPMGNAKDQFFPWLVRKTGGNCIKLIFNDRRDDPGNFFYNTYAAHSCDGGLTFDNKKVSTVASDPSIGFGGTFIGDYIGLDGTGSGGAQDVWTDTRLGNQDIFTAWEKPKVVLSNTDCAPLTFNPVTGGSATCSFTLNRDAWAALIVLDAFGNMVYVSPVGPDPLPMGNNSIPWAGQLTALADGPYIPVIYAADDIGGSSFAIIPSVYVTADNGVNPVISNFTVTPAGGSTYDIGFDVDKYQQWSIAGVLDGGGAWVRLLTHEAAYAGHQAFLWDGRDGSGNLVPPGTYWFIGAAADAFNRGAGCYNSTSVTAVSCFTFAPGPAGAAIPQSDLLRAAKGAIKKE